MFIRGFRASWLQAIVPMLRGAGGPSHLPDGDNDTDPPDMQLKSIPNETHVR